MQRDDLHIVILAAGKGKRMISSLPKVLHKLAGIPLLEHVVKTAETLNPKAIHVVYGHNGSELQDTLPHLNVNWVEQKEQLGTGHALLQAIPHITDNNAQVLVLYGDVPLISAGTLKHLCEKVPSRGIALLIADVNDPTGLGRIVRDEDGNFTAIIEHRDATETQLRITQIYTGMLTAPAGQLKKWLAEIGNKNNQQEYLLTDAPAIALQEGCAISTVFASNEEEIQGINNRVQLIHLERVYQQQKARELLLQGVTVRDPRRFDLRGILHCGKDVEIDINVIIEGTVTLGDNVTIGANTVLRNITVGNNVIIKENSILDTAKISDNCIVGPFARLRPGAVLQSNANVGNFVEIKKSTIGSHTKVNHLTYIGDATIGQRVNVGAGTITCNYDGVNKHQTHIGDDVFVGSGSQLVAPIDIGKGATIGAGSVITRNTPEEKLTLSRSKQVTIPGWQRPEEAGEER